MVERIKNKKGFTIIEIMVVIALIGILAAVLVPQFGGVKDRAKDAGMLTNAKMVEAYSASLVDSLTTTTASSVVTAIQNQFSGTTNGLKNPYDNIVADTNIVVTTGTAYSAGDDDGDDDAGVVYVVVDGANGKIFINAFNKSGTLLVDTQRTITK